jgi:hypothetical protein
LHGETRWDSLSRDTLLLPLIVKFGKMFGQNVGFDSELLPDISVDGAGVDETSGSVAEPLDGALACCREVSDNPPSNI